MKKRTGIVIPLGALYTDESPAVGDYPALIKLADFCEKGGISLIQLLPVNDSGTQSSPYSGLSAFALHPLYIRIEAIPEFEDAIKNDKSFASAYKAFNKKFKYSAHFNYEELNSEKTRVLHLLYSYIEKRIRKETKVSGNSKTKTVSVKDTTTFSGKFEYEVEKFADENPWVKEYAVFKNLKDAANQASWKEWDEDVRLMSRSQISTRWANKALKSSHNFFVWCQLRASEQFKNAADYIRSKGIILKGDMPILLNEDSADCWTYPEYFRQDWRAGSNPDGENPLGQDWGFPTYDWNELSKDGYKWWQNRVQSAAKYYDAFRIDHVLGFFRIWANSTKETCAYLGHTIPYKSFTRDTLNELGFDNDRIKWLSKAHIPTSVIEDITWNHDEAVSILSTICDRVGNEELWTFKAEIDGDKAFYSMNWTCDNEKNHRLADAFSKKYRDITLIEISKDEFVFVYEYRQSTSWKTLNEQEKESLETLKKQISAQENELWKEQALSTLTAITQASEMTACAEDLGVSLESMPEVLSSLNILSLKVIRWTRKWEEYGQPFVPFEKYPELSVATSSVHDSSTLRQWWNEEKDAVKAFLKFEENQEIDADEEFTPAKAEFILKAFAKANSAFFVNPLQDYLYVNSKYYRENPQDERINIPGSVNETNWTYRIPCTLEELMKDEVLTEKIKEIAQIHDNN